MNYIGTKELETERLVLKVPTFAEQKHLYEILMLPEVNKLYLAINKKFREKLLSWEKQEPFYKEKINNATNKDKFEWSVFLKENNECIGQVDSHISEKELGVLDETIFSLGWFIDPKYQGNGYATEAAKAMIEYMFEEVEINGFVTSSAISNKASWRIMEKVGFRRIPNKTIFNEYTFVDEPVESYLYELNKEDYYKNKL